MGESTDNIKPLNSSLVGNSLDLLQSLPSGGLWLSIGKRKGANKPGLRMQLNSTRAIPVVKASTLSGMTVNRNLFPVHDQGCYCGNLLTSPKRLCLYRDNTDYFRLREIKHSTRKSLRFLDSEQRWVNATSSKDVCRLRTPWD